MTRLIHRTITQIQYLPAFITVILLLGFFSNQVFGYFLGPIFFTLILCFFYAYFIEEKNFILRNAFSLTLFIGLSPVYLLVRGFFTKSPLGNLDLEIYALALLILLNLKSHLKIDQVFALNFFEKNNLKKYFASLFSLIVLLVTYRVLNLQSFGYSFAWFASGDSKNHMVSGSELVQYGYLDPTTFYFQPVSAPSFLSLVMSESGSSFETVNELLISRMQSFASVWILMIGILGVSFAALASTVQSAYEKPDDKAKFPLIIFASLMPLFSYSLGPALVDGFFTAVFGISSMTILLAWFLQISQRPDFSLSYLVLGGFITVCTIFAWMFIAPSSLIIYLLGIRNHLVKFSGRKIIVDLSFSAGIVSFLFLVHFSNFGQNLITSIKIALNTPGASNVNNPNLYLALLAAMLIFGLQSRQIYRSAAQISCALLVALLAFKGFSNLSLFEWNYYMLKYQWMMLVSLSALYFAIFSSVVFEKFNLKKQVIGTFIFSFSFFLLSESIVNSNSVWQKIYSGWDNPRAVTIDSFLNQKISTTNPTMFFHHGYAGESRLANFWLTAFVVPAEPLKGWNYTIDPTGNPQQLCDVNAYYPSVSVVTSDQELEESLKNLCPNEVFEVILEKPLFE